MHTETPSSTLISTLKKTNEKHLKNVLIQHQQDLPENKSITKLANTFKQTHLQETEQEQATEGENASQHQSQIEESHSKHPYIHFERLNR